MDISLKQKRVYAEVYNFLTLLGKAYINKIPKEILDIIKEEKDNSYKQKINPDISIESQGLLEESIAMILWLNLEYFSNEEQKELLEKIYENNQKIYEEELKEKYNEDNLFDKKENNRLLVSSKKKGILTKIIESIKYFFNKKNVGVER